jgi:hypothetical protein
MYLSTSGVGASMEGSAMVVDERIRTRIHQAFEKLIGPEEADALVANLITMQEVATKDDVRVLQADMRVLSAELRGEMADLRGELRGEIEKLRGETHRAIAEQTRWFVASNIGLVGVILAAAKLLF